MKRLLIFLSLATSFTLQAQSNEEKSSVGLRSEDPNARLKIDPKIIHMVCFAAKKPALDLYEKDLGFTVFEQMLFEAEGYDEDDISNLLKTNPKKPFEIIRDAWDSKWSKCWCQPNSNGGQGYVDVLLLGTEQFQSLRNIYNPKGKIKANVNKVNFIIPHDPTRFNEPMTLIDFIEVMIKEKWGQIGYSKSLADEIQSFSDELTKYYGAKKFKELSLEAQKIQIELMNRKPEEK